MACALFVGGAPSAGQIGPSVVGTDAAGWPGCGSYYADTVLNESPFAYWRLDESAGTQALDETRSGRNAVYGGAPRLGVAGATGDPGTAVALDGVDDRLSATPAGFPTAAITVEGWVRTTDPSKPGNVFSYAAGGDANALRLSDPRGFFVQRGSAGTVWTGVSANDGAWHHIVLSWRGSDGLTLLFKDGVIEFVGTLAGGTSLPQGGMVVLGQDQDVVGGGFEPEQAFAGHLDEFAIYRSALVDRHAVTHYRAASTTLPELACRPNPPLPPRDYGLPSGATLVDTSQELVSELADSEARDIILADGSYSTSGTSSSTGYFSARGGDRLYSRTLGGATLRAGLVFGGNSGAGDGEVHGVSFDVSDRSRSWNGAALGTWGSNGAGTKVYDSTFEGHYALDSGIEFREVEGTVIQRVVSTHFRRYGVYVSDCCDDNWYDNPATAYRITDVRVDGVREVVPGSSSGRAEYGVWIGNGVETPVNRLDIEHAWWSGLWTGSSSHDTIFRNVSIGTVDRPGGNAVYNEHRTTRNTFERFVLGPNIGEGFVCEWNYGSGPGACADTTFQAGVILSTRAGVYLDEGQVGNTVRRIRFAGQQCAAIVDNQGSGNSYGLNDFTAILPGALSVLKRGC